MNFDDKQKFIESITRLVDELGSATLVGGLIGVSERTVVRWLRGQNPSPRKLSVRNALDKLAKEYKID